MDADRQRRRVPPRRPDRLRRVRPPCGHQRRGASPRHRRPVQRRHVAPLQRGRAQPIVLRHRRARRRLGVRADAALLHDAHEAYTNDLISPAKQAVNSYSMAFGVGAWHAFEAEHAKGVREHFKLLSVFAGHRELLRSIDLQALATARRDLTPYTPSRHMPWPVLGDNTLHPVAPVDWIRLDTPEREHATWKDWRQCFLDRYHRLQTGADRR